MNKEFNIAVIGLGQIGSYLLNELINKKKEERQMKRKAPTKKLQNGGFSPEQRKKNTNENPHGSDWFGRIRKRRDTPTHARKAAWGCG